MNDAVNIVVSVVVPTFNRLDNLQRTVSSIGELDYDQSKLEIVVVDNSSSDGTQEWAEARENSHFRYIRKEPEGPSVARNRGLSEARGEFALIMDSDIVLAPDWLRIALDAMQSDSQLGCVGGKVLYSHKPECTNAFGGVLSPVGIAWDAHEGRPEEELTEAESCLWMNCSAMLTRADLARQIDFFDSAFFFGYEDSDYGWRINLLGFTCVVLPELRTYHHVGAEVRPGTPEFTFEYSKNRLRSVLKNYEIFTLAWVVPAYLMFTCADIALRPDKAAKARAVLWNFFHLRSTWKERRHIQRLRVVRDRELKHLFTERWFPEVRLGGRKRRPADHDGESSSTMGERTSRPDFWT